MSSVLESVEWGKPALSLLNQIKDLDPNFPAIMHIRHTERPKGGTHSIEYQRKHGKSMLTSTERGKKAAYDFGEKLPDNKKYRIYHTSIERTKETAQEIHEGLLSTGKQSKMEGIFMQINRNQNRLNALQRDIHDIGAPNARTFFINLINEHHPPWEIEPASIMAKRHAAQLMENFSLNQPESLGIYVSHDVRIAIFMFYWFGIVADERLIDFLDGFIVQKIEDKLHVYTKNGKVEKHLPYWWNF